MSGCLKCYEKFCYEFHVPKILNCGHIVCLICLYDCTNKSVPFTCPECREMFWFSRTDVKNLKIYQSIGSDNVLTVNRTRNPQNMNEEVVFENPNKMNLETPRPTNKPIITKVVINHSPINHHLNKRYNRSQSPIIINYSDRFRHGNRSP